MKKQIKLLLVLGVVILMFANCSPTPDTKISIITPNYTNSRFAISRVGIIEDELAFDNRRGIYIIKDTLTGIEYVGVSGIGISEIRCVPVGKVVVVNER